ncbi:hypothetical protein TNIN_132371 [Trichonephila inaurata madagascariensis]|uniref:Uncharacterized protein n=1 Tax=Trichonephila inaurata madagascariensis TaxID=2747483 RepID=A0A8X6XB64_9ARAC|nr:hypothetical protein TNIN_132371 [Trichonephila inaurata madagascariensis]
MYHSFSELTNAFSKRCGGELYTMKAAGHHMGSFPASRGALVLGRWHALLGHAKSCPVMRGLVDDPLPQRKCRQNSHCQTSV